MARSRAPTTRRGHDPQTSPTTRDNNRTGERAPAHRKKTKASNQALHNRKSNPQKAKAPLNYEAVKEISRAEFRTSTESSDSSDNNKEVMKSSTRTNDDNSEGVVSSNEEDSSDEEDKNNKSSSNQRVGQEDNPNIQYFNPQQKKGTGRTNPATPTTSDPKTSPNVRWTEIDHQMKKVIIDKTGVAEYVVSTVFPKLKFITGSGMTMDYSTDKRTICSLVLAGCNQVHSKNGIIWWETAKKQVTTEIKRLRNDATKSMKTAFMGKSH